MGKNKGLTFYKRRKKISPAALREVFSWIFGVFTAIFIAVVLNLFLGMKIQVVGVSMEPALYNGQQILINRFLYVVSSPKKGDVIAFLPHGNENAHYYVKRVVATSGDSVEIRDGILYVNDVPSQWVQEKILEPGIAANKFTLEAAEVFCIGDNPGNSEDSRSANIGAVEEKDIIGKVWFRARCQEAGMGLVK